MFAPGHVIDWFHLILDSTAKRVYLQYVWWSFSLIHTTILISKKHLSENAYSTVAKLSSTAEGVKALEEIMALNKSAVMPQTPTAVDSKPSLADLRMMMKDPRYWKDGEKDPTYISRVSKLFENVWENII